MSYTPFLSSDKQPLICREKMEFCDTVSQHHGRGCEPYFPEDPPPTPAVLGGVNAVRCSWFTLRQPLPLHALLCLQPEGSAVPGTQRG